MNIDDMTLDDKRDWLEKHGRLEIGPVVSSVNMYCVWRSHNGLEIIKFEQKSMNAIGRVYDDVVVQLFASCQGLS